MRIHEIVCVGVRVYEWYMYKGVCENMCVRDYMCVHV